MSADAYIQQMIAEGKLEKEAAQRIADSALEKLSAINQIFGHPIPPGLKGGLHAAGLGAALAGGGTVAAMGAQHGAETLDHLVQSVMKGTRFNRMMKAAPDLTEEDPGHLHMAFDTLHRFAPEMAADPLVASTFVRQALHAAPSESPTPRVQSDQVGKLIKARSDLNRPVGAGHSSAAGQSFTRGVGDVLAG